MKRYLVYLTVSLSCLLSIEFYALAEEIVVIFSGEELGTLEPCGCYEGQLGGISKRYSFIDSLRKQKNVILPVSFGDLIKSSGRQEEIKFEILCRALGKMDYVVHNLGEKDIEISPQVLSFLSQTGGVNFLSSNLKIVAPFPIKINQYIIKDCSVNGHPLKIAFLGILSQSFLGGDVLNYVSVSNPVEVIGPLLKQLKDKVNLVVLLSHAPLEESREIAKLFPEIGLVITGHNIEEPKDAVTYVNNIPIVTSGVGGKYVGIVKYSIYKGAIKRKSIDIIPLDHAHSDAKEIAFLLKEYQQILREEDLLSKIPQTPLPKELSYVGSFVCGTCHKIIYNHWSKTRHGSTYKTLVSAGRQYDPECIKCHTTGYGDISGFLNYEENQNLINVGCESCHGAGSNHVKHVNDPDALITGSRCEVCHDSEHSPKFQHKEYWKKIEHPAEMIKKGSE